MNCGEHKIVAYSFKLGFERSMYCLGIIAYYLRGRNPIQYMHYMLYICAYYLFVGVVLFEYLLSISSPVQL